MEGEELGQSRKHLAAAQDIAAVLKWYFAGQEVDIDSELNFYQTDDAKEPPLCPDVAVIRGMRPDSRAEEDLPSYYIGEDGPPPVVVFEVASPTTWRVDLEEKPAKYAQAGVSEYFTFDPRIRTVWRGGWRDKGRLVGWRRDKVSGQLLELPKDAAGRLWSEELDSWLVVEGDLLKLYSREGQLRLTETEAEQLRANLAEQQTRHERQRTREAELQTRHERQRTREAELQIRHERQRTREAELQTEAERKNVILAEQKAKEAEQKAERLAELLRQAGYSPDIL